MGSQGKKDWDGDGEGHARDAVFVVGGDRR